MFLLCVLRGLRLKVLQSASVTLLYGFSVVHYVSNLKNIYLKTECAQPARRATLNMFNVVAWTLNH